MRAARRQARHDEFSPSRCLLPDAQFFWRRVSTAMSDSEMMYSGFICCYTACDFKDIALVGKGSGTLICLEEKFCCQSGVDQYPVGLIKEDGFICKVGLPCCTSGLKVPDTKDLVSFDCNLLILKFAIQLPFGEKGVCALATLSRASALSHARPMPLTIMVPAACVRACLSQRAGLRHVLPPVPPQRGLRAASRQEGRRAGRHRDGPLSAPRGATAGARRRFLPRLSHRANENLLFLTMQFCGVWPRVCVSKVCVCVCARAWVCAARGGALRDFDALASRQTAASRRNIRAEIATPLSAHYGGDGNCDHLDIEAASTALSPRLSTSAQ